MFHFSKDERIVLISLGVIITLGVSLQYLFKTNPQFKNIISTLESERIYAKTNLNTASHKELVNIPGIGDVLAGRILQYRETHGKFKNLEELKNVSGIGAATYASVRKYLTLSP